MFKKSNLILAIGILLGLSYGFIRYWPDGKLHLIFCDVGQGDAIYIRFPNGGDMLIDGGPNDKVLSCLGRHMPFYDRTIDVVALTHPQKDHLQGLVSVIQRYKSKHFVTIPVSHTIEGYAQLVRTLRERTIPVHFLFKGEKIQFAEVEMTTLWPDQEWLLTSLDLDSKKKLQLLASQQKQQILGFATDKDLNIYSLYVHLKLKNFDVLLTGDGDDKVQNELKQLGLFEILPERIEVLKVPHHGSRTAMTTDFINRVRPQLSIIQVGRNSYGHPAPELLDLLSQSKILRNDISGDIEVVSDGRKWWVIE